MKPCDDCTWPAYCNYDGLCWLEETRREDRARAESDRHNARNQQAYEAKLKPKHRGKK